MAAQTASSGGKQTSPSSSPQTKPTGKPRRSSPRAALLRMPPLRRARNMCNSASLMVPFGPILKHAKHQDTVKIAAQVLEALILIDEDKPGSAGLERRTVQAM